MCIKSYGQEILSGTIIEEQVNRVNQIKWESRYSSLISLMKNILVPAGEAEELTLKLIEQLQ